MLSKRTHDHLGHVTSNPHQFKDTSHLVVFSFQNRIITMDFGLTIAKPDHRDRRGREQARTYTIASRTKDRVRGQYTPLQRQLARDLAIASCQTYIATLGT